MANYGIHTYKGEDFEDFQGFEIEVKDDTANNAYSIRFNGENGWHDNMDDDDIEWAGKPVSDEPQTDTCNMHGVIKSACKHPIEYQALDFEGYEICKLCNERL